MESEVSVGCWSDCGPAGQSVDAAFLVDNAVGLLPRLRLHNVACFSSFLSTEIERLDVGELCTLKKRNRGGTDLGCHQKYCVHVECVPYADLIVHVNRSFQYFQCALEIHLRFACRSDKVLRQGRLAFRRGFENHVCFGHSRVCLPDMGIGVVYM